MIVPTMIAAPGNKYSLGGIVNWIAFGERESGSSSSDGILEGKELVSNYSKP